jgi:hypothetical protein
MQTDIGESTQLTTGGKRGPRKTARVGSNWRTLVSLRGTVLTNAVVGFQRRRADFRKYLATTEEQSFECQAQASAPVNSFTSLARAASARQTSSAARKTPVARRARSLPDPCSDRRMVSDGRGLVYRAALFVSAWPPADFHSLRSIDANGNSPTVNGAEPGRRRRPTDPQGFLPK